MKFRLDRVRFRAALKRVDLLRRGVRSVRRWRGRHVADLWRAHGEESQSGRSLRLLVAGDLATRHYLAGLLYGSPVRHAARTVIPRRLLEPAARLLGRHCDLIVIEGSRPEAPLPEGAFWIPDWVGGEIEFAETERLKRTSRRLQADFRRLRKFPHRVQTTRAPSEIYRFYCEFYLPYIRETFGDGACLASWDELEARLGQSELFWIMQDGERLAGQIVLYEPERVRAWYLGVRPGGRDLIRAGIIPALYQAQIQHLAQNGFARLHLGASRPFLTDGTLRFKRKWGMRLVDYSDRGMLFLPRRASDPMRAFLAAHPFVSVNDQGKMQANALIGPAQATDFVLLEREILPPELGRPFYYELHDGGAVPSKGLASAA